MGGGSSNYSGTSASPTVRDNMGQYLAELFQDVWDFGYNTAKGAHAVVLYAIEEQRATLEDISHMNLIRTQYSHKVIIVVPSGLNINKWEEYLQGYWDHQLIFS